MCQYFLTDKLAEIKKCQRICWHFVFIDYDCLVYKESFAGVVSLFVAAGSGAASGKG